MIDGAPVLELSGLTVRLPGGDPIVEDVDLSLAPGEILGVVGESGAGKTTTGLALLGYSSSGGAVLVHEMKIAGEPMHSQTAMRTARGRRVSYVPQNPGASLNPSMRIGHAVEDMLRAHRPERLQAGAARKLLASVGLPDTDEFERRFPHQLSGGQQQRACIALALAADPLVLILDEPTTGLDVVTQAHILSELRRLRDEQHVSMLYVTHDLAVVAELADRIAVMYAGRVVELGGARQVLRNPRHPYTRGLLASIPDHLRPHVLRPMKGIAVGVGDRPTGCSFAPRCELKVERCVNEMPELEPVDEGRLCRCFEWERATQPSARPPLPSEAARDVDATAVLEVTDLTAVYRGHAGDVVAASDVSFRLRQGSCLALVGESGSGKTTIARAIAGLHPLAAGSISLSGAALHGRAARRSRDERRRVQIVFQNPLEALNPRHSVYASIARPIHTLRGLPRNETRGEVARLLECVRLPALFVERFPHELSGGERQRVAIARALAADPEVIICDEITSALDVSVQAAVLSLLAELQRNVGVSLLFITHDLGVVASIADDVLVLEHGRVCEEGPVVSVLQAPQHPYTKRLLDAAPSLSRAQSA
jgi:peptide/nickel transport system ATP-binding protein